jgi:histidinol phosphatase-like PHP family hydrolase
VTVGIADQVSSRNTPLFVSDAARLERYLAAIERAPVFRSAELCWCDSFSESVTEELFARLDYLIGSNHGFSLPDGFSLTPWTRSLPPAWASRPQEVMELIVDTLCGMVSGMPISIAAHSTLLPPALLTIDPNVLAWWTEEREARFIDAAIRGRVAIEISNRYRLPHARFLVRAREAGARFTLGSDGHQADQVARLDWAVEAATRAGIGDEDLFTPRRR